MILSQTVFGQVKYTETQKLAATCKVWGFLKYYHPKVAKAILIGTNNFLKFCRKLTKTKEEFSLIIENWVDSLGEVKEIIPITQPKEIDYFDKNFDLSWIDKNRLFSKKLSKKLKFIENNRFQGNQHYIETEGAGNISVRNENYSELKRKNIKSGFIDEPCIYNILNPNQKHRNLYGTKLWILIGFKSQVNHKSITSCERY